MTLLKIVSSLRAVLSEVYRVGFFVVRSLPRCFRITVFVLYLIVVCRRTETGLLIFLIWYVVKSLIPNSRLSVAFLFDRSGKRMCRIKVEHLRHALPPIVFLSVASSKPVPVSSGV